jgi:hypothetical protein
VFLIGLLSLRVELKSGVLSMSLVVIMQIGTLLHALSLFCSSINLDELFWSICRIAFDLFDKGVVRTQAPIFKGALVMSRALYLCVAHGCNVQP